MNANNAYVHKQFDYGTPLHVHYDRNTKDSKKKKELYT